MSEVNWDSIAAVQSYITRWANANFPARTAHHALSKLVMEEVPELLRELKPDNDGQIDRVKLELEYADTLILLFDLASLWRIDIQRGLENKMQINEHRMWKADEAGVMHHVSAKHPPITEQGRGR